MLAFHIVTVVIVALTWALSLAHALELPGKMRLNEDQYSAVQRIYYPGFTLGGISEPLAIVATAVLVFLAPAGATFWLVVLALLGAVATHAVYWIRIHPVNRYWVEGQSMGSAGTGFFGVSTKSEGPAPDWTALRDRWEYSHLARAVLTSVSFVALVVSLAVRP
jgi:hypothetical protein